MNRTGPVQQENRFSVLNNPSLLSLFASSSSPRTLRTPFPLTLNPETLVPVFAILAPLFHAHLAHFLSLSTSSSFSLFQHIPFPNHRNHLAHRFSPNPETGNPKTHSVTVSILSLYHVHPLYYSHPPSTHTTNRRSRGGGFGYKEVEGRHSKVKQSSVELVLEVD